MPYGKEIIRKIRFEVSIVGFGGIPIQRTDKDLAVELLQAAHDEGINFIDTARGYNNSEELLGHALNTIGRDKFILASKSFAKDYEGIKKDVEISLSELNIDYIDLFQFHNVPSREILDSMLEEGGALTALEELVEEGKIKEIGITSHSAEVLDYALDFDVFTTIQFPYNPVERQGEEIFKKAKKNNVGVIIMKPLAGGAIPKGEICLRFIFENENVTVAIPGMENVEQIKENARAGKNRRALNKAEREELDSEVVTLGAKFCRRCGYCKPCQVGIDIPSQFILDGYYTRYNLGDWAHKDIEIQI